MSKNLDQVKSNDLICKINKVRCQLRDVDILQMRRSYKQLEHFIQKIYTRQRKVARRETNHLIGKVTASAF